MIAWIPRFMLNALCMVIQLASPHLVIGNVEKSDLGVVLSHTSPQHSCKRCTGRKETQLFKPQDRWWHRMVYHREKCHLSWSKRTCKRKLPAKCRLLFKEFLTPKYSKEKWNMITICYNLQGLRLPYVYRPYLILSSCSFVPIGSVQAWRIPCAQGCVLGRGSISLPSAWPGVASCRSVLAHHAERRGGKESHCEQLSDVKRHEAWEKTSLRISTRCQENETIRLVVTARNTPHILGSLPLSKYFWHLGKDVSEGLSKTQYEWIFNDLSWIFEVAPMPQ